MKNVVYEIRPFMALLLILAVMVPVGVTILPTTPAMATVDNVTINIPTSGSPAYSKIGGLVTENISIGITGAANPIDVRLSLMQGGAPIGTPTNYLIATSDATIIKTYTYDLVIPAGTTNGTYDIKVEARHPAGSGSYTSSSVVTGAVVINSTHVPATPTGLLPASGFCSISTTPTFSWTAVTETGYTFTYNFQLSPNTSFSPTTVSINQAGVSYTSGALAVGLYYWRVQAQDQFGNTGSWAGPYSICIDNATPSVPTAGAVGTTNGYYNPTYSWTASTDGATACANVRYCVETSSDAFVTAADNATNIINNSYTVSGTLPAGTYRWRVRAYDCAGNTSVFSENGTATFTILTPVTTASLSLGTGWNLMSLPICPSSSTSITPAALLALCDNTSAIQIIWGYDCSSGWQYYIPGSSSSLTSISVAKGYWVQTGSPVNITITGSPCPAPPQSLITATLCPGWNLVGFKSTSTMAATSYFPAATHANISFICSYSGGWNCNAPSTTTLEPRKGYWVYYGGSSNSSYGLPCY